MSKAGKWFDNRIIRNDAARVTSNVTLAITGRPRASATPPPTKLKRGDKDIFVVGKTVIGGQEVV